MEQGEKAWRCLAVNPSQRPYSPCYLLGAKHELNVVFSPPYRAERWTKVLAGWIRPIVRCTVPFFIHRGKTNIWCIFKAWTCIPEGTEEQPLKTKWTGLSLIKHKPKPNMSCDVWLVIKSKTSSKSLESDTITSLIFSEAYAVFKCYTNIWG